MKSDTNVITKQYDFGGKRSIKSQYFVVRLEVSSHKSNGKVKNLDVYKLCIIRESEKYTCKEISIQHNKEQEVSIPSLAGWSYDFDIKSLNKDGVDEHGLMLGIPHDKFENMVDSKNKKISIEAQYQVYSLFTYFHSLCNMTPEVYAKDLKKIGNELKNDYSATESPINLGSIFLEGSKFIHGTETINFKGLSIVDDKVCAIIGLDERGGGYIMHMRPMTLLRIKTVAGTRFWGDIYIDLDLMHVKKVNATVIDISKTSMYRMPVDITIPITTIKINSVSKEEFNKG